MKIHEPAALRNIGIFGHGSTGKTSVSESMLFVAGVTNRLGRVEDGNTVMDYEPEEIKKTASINAAFGSFSWKKRLVNIVDTPGDANFISDAQNVLAAVDGALLMICAASGVEVQTEKLWELTSEMGIPKVLFINKLDRERADFDKVLGEIRDNFKISPLPLQIPIGQEDSFVGVVDLLTQKAYEFDESGKPKAIDVPADMSDRIEEYRTVAIETIAENDEELMDKYLEGEELPMDKVFQVIRTGVASGEIIPVLCGSATKNKGVVPLLDFLVETLPSPLDREPFTGNKPESEDEATRESNPSAPFSGIVFKTIIDPFAGKLTVFRVLSGEIDPDSQVYNANKEAKERFGQLLKMNGKKQEPIDKAVCGDIVAVAKLKETATGDTLCDEKDPLIYKMITVAVPNLSFAIQPKSKGDEEKITTGLARLTEEDPTIRVTRDVQTKEIILSGMGTGHLEITVEKLRRKFGVEVILKTPKVPYKETVKGKATVRYRHKKQSGGRGQFGECEINLLAQPRGAGYLFEDKIFGGSIPRQFIPAVDKGIQDALGGGVLAGYPTVDFRVELTDGKFHPVDSSEMAFKIAGSQAFKQAAAQAKPTLLEPVMKMEIVVPEENTGDVMGDLSGRRGAVSGYEAKGKNTVIRAQVPMSEVLRYEPDLRSMTSGKGTFQSEFSHYEEVPQEIQLKIIDAAKKEQEES
jgi:elongation factor G